MTAGAMSRCSPLFLGHGTFQEAYAKVKPTLNRFPFFLFDRVGYTGLEPNVHGTYYSALGAP